MNGDMKIKIRGNKNANATALHGASISSVALLIRASEVERARIKRHNYKEGVSTVLKPRYLFACHSIHAVLTQIVTRRRQGNKVHERNFVMLYVEQNFVICLYIFISTLAKLQQYSKSFFEVSAYIIFPSPD